MHLFSSPPPPPPPKRLIPKIPTRAVIAIMMFLSCLVNYMMRVNMSINIIAMVPDKKPTTTSTTQNVLRQNLEVDYNETMRCHVIDPYSKKISFVQRSQERDQPEHVQTFEWTTTQQGYVLSGYFWGYACGCLVGGTASEFFGAKRVILASMFGGAVFTVLSPAAAKIDYKLLVGVRYIVGFGGGFLFPSLHTLVANWAPPQEKGKFVSALLGGAIGTCFTWCLSGPLIKVVGWEWAFYVPGIITFLWCFLWFFLVYEKPTVHPRISEQEKKYILDCIGDRVSQTKKKVVPPFAKMLTSSPFLAHIILHYGSNWGLYFIMTAAPKYMSSVLGFNLSASGFLSSLPYLGRMVFSLFFGAIGDKIMKEKCMSVTVMRKFFTIFSHVIPGCFLLSLGWSTNAPMCVVFMALSLAFNGAACLTNLVNHQDLAPNFAGTLFGLANGFGNTAGFITPLVTAYFTREGNTIIQWRPVFIVGAVTYIGCAVYFMIFGSGKIQKWNTIVEKPANK